MADNASDIDHVWKLIGEIPIAMVVTHEGQGENMRSRPMAVRPAKEEGAIYFLTDAGTPKAEEIGRNQSVCLAMSDNKGQKYVSISGHAEMINDRERIKKYWSVYDKAFWPDKNDPRIRILRVTPESAEFWEGNGRIVTAVKLVAAIASGERMDLGHNERVGFPQGGKLAG
jgi:general stress protein 26